MKPKPGFRKPVSTCWKPSLAVPASGQCCGISGRYRDGTPRPRDARLRREALYDQQQRADAPDRHELLLRVAPEVAAQRPAAARGGRVVQPRERPGGVRAEEARNPKRICKWSRRRHRRRRRRPSAPTGGGSGSTPPPEETRDVMIVPIHKTP
eukprot:gene8823-biopygen7595